MDYEYWIRLAAGRRPLCPRSARLVAGSRMYATNKTLGSRVEVHAEINDMMRAHLHACARPLALQLRAFGAGRSRHPARSDRLQFTMLVSALSLSAAVRWNRRISRSMVRTVCQWVGHAVREELRAS